MRADAQIESARTRAKGDGRAPAERDGNETGKSRSAHVHGVIEGEVVNGLPFDLTVTRNGSLRS